jgi:hypothetical protein
MQELVGQKVTIHSESAGAERQDVGILEAFDGTILKLKTERGTLMFFSIYWVRLVKPF